MARYTRRPATKASRMLSRMVREYNAAQHKLARFAKEAVDATYDLVWEIAERDHHTCPD